MFFRAHFRNICPTFAYKSFAACAFTICTAFGVNAQTITKTDTTPANAAPGDSSWVLQITPGGPSGSQPVSINDLMVGFDPSAEVTVTANIPAGLGWSSSVTNNNTSSVSTIFNHPNFNLADHLVRQTFTVPATSYLPVGKAGGVDGYAFFHYMNGMDNQYWMIPHHSSTKNIGLRCYGATCPANFVAGVKLPDGDASTPVDDWQYSSGTSSGVNEPFLMPVFNQNTSQWRLWPGSSEPHHVIYPVTRVSKQNGPNRDVKDFGVGCFDIRTASECGFLPLGPNDPDTTNTTLKVDGVAVEGPYVDWKNETMYFIDIEMQLHCVKMYDPLTSPGLSPALNCGTFDLHDPALGFHDPQRNLPRIFQGDSQQKIGDYEGYGLFNGEIVEDRLLVSINFYGTKDVNGNQNQNEKILICFDLATQTSCNLGGSGWGDVGQGISLMPTPITAPNYSLYIISKNGDQTDWIICTGLGSSMCFSVADGQPVSTSTLGNRVMDEVNPFARTASNDPRAADFAAQIAAAGLNENRIYFPTDNPNVACKEFTPNANSADCAGFGTSGKTQSLIPPADPTKALNNYLTTIDPHAYSFGSGLNCLAVTNHTNEVWWYDSKTGKNDCLMGDFFHFEMNVALDNDYYCHNTNGRVLVEAIEPVNFDPNDWDNFIISFADTSGNPIPGMGSVDLVNSPVTAINFNMQSDFKVIVRSRPKITNPPSVDFDIVKRLQDPMEICVSAEVCTDDGSNIMVSNNAVLSTATNTNISQSSSVKQLNTKQCEAKLSQCSIDFDNVSCVPNAGGYDITLNATNAGINPSAAGGVIIREISPTGALTGGTPQWVPFSTAVPAGQSGTIQLHVSAASFPPNNPQPNEFVFEVEMYDDGSDPAGKFCCGKTEIRVPIPTCPDCVTHARPRCLGTTGTNATYQLTLDNTTAYSFDQIHIFDPTGTHQITTSQSQLVPGSNVFNITVTPPLPVNTTLPITLKFSTSDLNEDGTNEACCGEEIELTNLYRAGFPGGPSGLPECGFQLTPVVLGTGGPVWFSSNRGR